MVYLPSAPLGPSHLKLLAHVCCCAVCVNVGNFFLLFPIQGIETQILELLSFAEVL